MALLEGPRPQFAGDHSYLPSITGLCVRCRQPESEHVVEVIMHELRLANRVYGEAPARWQAAHGRGQLSQEWKSFARIHLTPIDSEYR